MGKRFHIWWVILGILIIGTCVTKITRDFVTEHGVETSAPALPASEHVLTGAAAYDGDLSVEEETYDAGMPAAETEMAGRGRSVSEGAVDVQESAIPMEAAMTEDIAGPDALPEETVEEAAPSAQTVKSPLDPFVESKAAHAPMEQGAKVYSRDELAGRFEKAEATVAGLWSNMTAGSEEAVLTAAEQERMLWAYELKLVTEAVQRNMSKEENEAFKILEAEWMKERDLYAAQQSADSQSKNGQAAEYSRAVAEKSKERCYWMLSQYESILNRRNGQ